MQSLELFFTFLLIKVPILNYFKTLNKSNLKQDLYIGIVIISIMETSRLYDLFSKRYDSLLSKKTLRKNEEKILHHLFKEKITSKDVVLELGAGTGYFTIYLSSLCKKIIAIEPSKGMLNELINKSNNKNNIIIKKSNFEELNIKKKFDVIVAIGLSEHVDLKDLISFFINSKAKKAIFTFPTMTFSSFKMKLFFLLFGIKCNIYNEKKIGNFLQNFKSIKYKMTRVPLKYFKHHTVVLEIEKYIFMNKN
jgi:2-polyprenyl-3-methyl-5-hydroxy-6-metoxy-1,4-benzoquinol methylase